MNGRVGLEKRPINGNTAGDRLKTVRTRSPESPRIVRPKSSVSSGHADAAAVRIVGPAQRQCRIGSVEPPADHRATHNEMMVAPGVIAAGLRRPCLPV